MGCLCIDYLHLNYIYKGAVDHEKRDFKRHSKFILLMTAVIVVFVLALTAIIKFAPDPVRTTSYDEPQQTASSQQSAGTDFDSVKERVDEANNTIGKEIYSLYSGEGASVLQRQAESRLFFSNLKNLLICILLVVVLIVLCKKGFVLKRSSACWSRKNRLPPKRSLSRKRRKRPGRQKDRRIKRNRQKSVPTADVEEEPPAEEPPLEAEPPLKEEPESEEAPEDEKQVAENCRL